MPVDTKPTESAPFKLLDDSFGSPLTENEQCFNGCVDQSADMNLLGQPLDKSDFEEMPEELSLSVRKVSIQSDDVKDTLPQPFSTPRKIRSFSNAFEDLKPINTVEDAGTEASMDEYDYNMVANEHPKLKAQS